MTALKKFTAAILLIICQTICSDDVSAYGLPTDSATTQPTESATDYDPFAENGYLGHFTWGAGLASGVDLTSRDMTNFAISAEFGYKNRLFRFLGMGASIVSMMNNSSRYYPIYAMLRTSFSQRHQLCFLELRGGVSVNHIFDAPSHTGGYGSIGIGITLAHKRTFSSHVVLRTEVFPVEGVYDDPTFNFSYTLAMACIGIGIAF